MAAHATARAQVLTATALHLAAYTCLIAGALAAALGRGGDLLVLAGLLCWFIGLVPFARWYGTQSRLLGVTAGPRVNSRGLVWLLFVPLPLGGLASTHVFAMQVAAARESRGLRGIDPSVLAGLMVIVPPLGWLVAQREVERITAAPAAV